ncbi:MAG: tyrosine-type recombinase/integrase [Anaerolineales bacterium]
MKAAIARFLSYLKHERASAENTLLAYSTDVGQFEQVLSVNTGSPVKPEDLKPSMVANYARWLEGQGYRPSTVSRKMAASRAFLIYLEQQEGVISSSTYEVLHPPPAPRTLPQTLSRDEIHRLIEAPARTGTPRGLRDAAILGLLYVGGLRASEAVGSNLEDVDLDRAMFVRRDTDPLSLGLGIALDPMQDYLRAGRPYLVKDDKEQALFLNLRGKRLSRQGLWLVVKRWAAAEGFGAKISPHTLRHSLIRHLLDDGKSKRDIQHMLGLSSPNAIRVSSR